MGFKLCSILLCLALLKACHGFSWEPCGMISTSSIKNVSLTPETPNPGSNVTFVVEGVVGATVDEGTLAVAVSYLGIRVYSQTGELCSQTTCPVKEGPLELVLEKHFPKITPPGFYTVTITATSPDLDTVDPLWCVEVHFNVVYLFNARPAVKAIQAAIQSGGPRRMLY